MSTDSSRILKLVSLTLFGLAIALQCISVSFAFLGGYAAGSREVTQLRSDRDELHAIADMREALFQQDERKLAAVSWCISSSPTPTECAAYALRPTK